MARGTSPGQRDGAGERVRFQTETGSIYELARAASGETTWQRLSATLASGPLRTDGGRLLEWPEVIIGARCVLQCEPLNPPAPRIVATSFVVTFLDDQGHAMRAESGRARRTFRYLRVRDMVTRVVAGVRFGPYPVKRIEDDLVYAGLWAFDWTTGIEVDPTLGFGPGGLVGSWLIHPDGEDD